MSDSNRIIPGCYSQDEIDKDRRIAELEAEKKSQVKKTIEARQETHLAIIQKRQAEAALAERDRMLVKEYESSTPRVAGYMRWYEDLRARAEEGSGT